MANLLGQLREFLGERNNSKAQWLRPDLETDTMNEVSEHRGVLLVRLGRGSAMQLVVADGTVVLYRIVPIASAKRVDEDFAWQRATDARVRAWLHEDSEIGPWLLAKGLRCGHFVELLTEAALF